MIDIVGDAELTCVLTGEKTYRREVGYCFTSDGVDINQSDHRLGVCAGMPALRCPLL